jgi:hypothetical protein
VQAFSLAAVWLTLEIAMPRVLNKYKDVIPPDAVYIGRPSKWGNPYALGTNGDRTTVIDKFTGYVLNHPTLANDARRELRGKDLVCFCAPRACHGDVLLRIANED